MQQRVLAGPLVASLSRKGSEHMVNQDTALAAVDTSGGRQVAYAAVFDGHGVMGEVAASVARETLGRLMVHAASKDEWFRAPEETISHLISDLHDAVIRSHQPEEMALPYKHRVRHYELTYDLSEDGRSFLVRGGDGGEFYEPIDFGCTACIAVLLVDGTSQRVICANLGDSPALLCRGTRDGLYDATELSRRHAASEESEQLRLRDFLGDSTAASITSGTLRGMQGPLEGHALEPTRGLGHPVFSEFGFSQEPHVLSMDVDGSAGVHALVVVTDGVSDALTNQEILQSVLSSAAVADLPHSLGLGEHVAGELISRAVSRVDGGVHDDVSAALVLFNMPASTRSTRMETEKAVEEDTTTASTKQKASVRRRPSRAHTTVRSATPESRRPHLQPRLNPRPLSAQTARAKQSVPARQPAAAPRTVLQPSSRSRSTTNQSPHRASSRPRPSGGNAPKSAALTPTDCHRTTSIRPALTSTSRSSSRSSSITSSARKTPK